MDEYGYNFEKVPTNVVSWECPQDVQTIQITIQLRSFFNTTY